MVLFRHPDEFRLECTVAPPGDAGEGGSEGAQNGSGWTGAWRIGKDADAVAQPARALREFAAFSLTDNRATNVETSHIQLALARAWTHDDRPLSGLIYVAGDRSETDDPAKTENNLAVYGGRIALRVDRSRRGPADGTPRPDHYLGLDLAYLTDFEGRADAVRARLDFNPGIDQLNYRFFNPLWGSEALDFAWTLNLTPLDVLEINDLGLAFAAEAQSTSRYGADLAFLFRPAEDWAIGSPLLAIRYGLREPHGGDQPHLSMFNASLALKPSKQSPFSFAIGYADGEDFSTLKEREEWTLSLGVRY